MLPRLFQNRILIRLFHINGLNGPFMHHPRAVGFGDGEEPVPVGVGENEIRNSGIHRVAVVAVDGVVLQSPFGLERQVVGVVNIDIRRGGFVIPTGG